MAPPSVLTRHVSPRTSCPTDWDRRDSDKSELNQVSEHLMLFPERNYKWHFVGSFLKIAEILKKVVQLGEHEWLNLCFGDQNTTWLVRCTHFSSAVSVEMNAL